MLFRINRKNIILLGVRAVDQLPGYRSGHPVCGWVRHGARLYPLVLRDRTILAVRPAHRQLNRRRRQLVR